MKPFRPPRPQLLVLLVGAAFACSAAVSRYYPVGGSLTVYSRIAVTKPYVFPNGGRTLFPSYRLVALYGVPDTPVLGALGEQPIDATIDRVKALAALYQPLMNEHSLPTLEIIATVASAFPEPDGSYSYRLRDDTLRQWISAAKEHGTYVVLDLQPGRSDFLSQAQQLEPLLSEPNVGLALDPEWRLGPAQLPLVQIGSVNIDEVNQTAQWLATLTARHHLPQKLFLLHQFQLSMLPERETLDTSHPQLAYAIQMDGQGSQPAKLDTWQAITTAAPANVYFGWKNFYKKDLPTRSPEDTMALSPKPWYISYQ